jgi:hypothetical protein
MRLSVFRDSAHHFRFATCPWRTRVPCLATIAAGCFLLTFSILLNGCAPTSYSDLLLQQTVQTFPDVSFQQPAPIQVEYANDIKTVSKAVFTVLDEISEKIESIDKEQGIILTRQHNFTDLVGKPAGKDVTAPVKIHTYRCALKLTKSKIGMKVAMESTFSPPLNSGQSASGPEIVRQIFFHGLNKLLTPRLFTFRDHSITYTKDAAEVLAPDFIEYIFRSDDTLSLIAGRYTDSADNWRQIAAVNGIKDPRNVANNQKILIPRSLLREPYRSKGIPKDHRPARTVSISRQDSGKAPECGENGADCIMHRVGTNESLSMIADKYTGDGNNWQKIAAINHIKNPGTLAAGQAVFIPKQLLLDKAVSDSRQLTFLTVYPQSRKTMHNAVLSVFKKFSITPLRSEPAMITSTVWKYDSISFTFSISLQAKGEGTELAILCAVAPTEKESNGDFSARAQQWVEESFFQSIDHAIQEQVQVPGSSSGKNPQS